MTEFVLTHEAATKLYAAPTSLIVTSSALKRVMPYIAKDMCIIVLRPDGVLHRPTEKNIDKATCTIMRGLPASIIAFVGHKSEQTISNAFIQFIEAVAPVDPPQNLHLKWHLSVLERRKVRSFFNKLYTSFLSQTGQQLAKSARRLVSLRQENETLRMQVAQASMMIRAMDMSTRYITVDLAPGQDTLGPGGDVGCAEFSQTLPVACAGLCGVSLYVSSLPDMLETEAELTVKFSRAADGQVFSEQRISAGGLKLGWNSFPVAGRGMHTICDAVITVKWHTAEGVLLALSDTVPDRFGSDGRTLALQIQQGLVAPEMLLPVSGSENQQQNPIVVHSEKQVRVKRFPEVGDILSFYTGYEAHEKLCNKYQLPVLTQNGETRVIQLHPLAEDISAMVYKDAIPANATKVACEVGTAHASAPTFVYVLIALKAATANNEALIEDICQRVNAGQNEGQIDEGACWNSHALGAQEKRFIELNLHPDNEGTPYHAVMAVLPKGDNTSYGWCRWYNFAVFTDDHSHQKNSGA